jgi:hypothetical protein
VFLGVAKSLTILRHDLEKKFNVKTDELKIVCTKFQKSKTPHGCPVAKDVIRR